MLHGRMLIEALPEAAPEPERIAPGRFPYLNVRMGAACCLAFENEYYVQGAYLWLVLEADERERDLEPEHAGFAEEGRCPEWVDYVLEEFGLRHVLGCEDDDVLDWSIREGIAPGQPFLVYVERPWTDKFWTDCGYEYEVEYNAWVVRRLPVECGPREYEGVVATLLKNRREVARETAR